MTAKVNDVYAAGQFMVGSLAHFTVTHSGMASSDLELIYKTVATKGTPVIIGAIDGDDVRVAVENSSGWTTADLTTALGAGFSAADFAY